ncbi:MAG TPA: hypothetical protein VGR55_16660 [Candidatus Acidoferrum sp.]|nr:hypothetical protein [Candidatus Acidoferrum sp.]
MKNRKKTTANTPWDWARGCQLIGVDATGVRTEIDRGVNFFILALRHLGATTIFSCEGHPSGFYVVFRSTEKLARRVHSCGYFSVELERGPKMYSLRLRDVDRLAEGKRDVVLWTEKSKARVLQWASAAWWKEFGSFPLPDRPLDIKA